MWLTEYHETIDSNEQPKVHSKPAVDCEVDQPFCTALGVDGICVPTGVITDVNRRLLHPLATRVGNNTCGRIFRRWVGKIPEIELEILHFI